MGTATVYITHASLANYIKLISLGLDSMDEEEHTKAFEKYPVRIYNKNPRGIECATVNIPIMEYILFLGYDLIK